LRDLEPEHEFFIGIDSDGCAFDTMEIKHKECFAPNTIRYWGLQPVSKIARETIEFVNLYSKWRGINRWPALIMVLDLLREREEVIQRQVEIPHPASLRAFVVQTQHPLSNTGLKVFMAEHPGDPDLDRAWNWTTAVNQAIADTVVGVPPFPHVRETLEALHEQADMVVISATPGDALVKEWTEHQIAHYVRVIAGQEMGTKREHIAHAAAGRYDPEKTLMLGDAPGDMQAAKANNALFYPIIPGDEERSWRRFYEDGMERFFTGTFAGEYESELIAEFERSLPSVPPWKRKPSSKPSAASS
jgi:phosphoglycolate phosphatase-like HAD superfamily hydrolase